jgi:hypothetical protein
MIVYYGHAAGGKKREVGEFTAETRSSQRLYISFLCVLRASVVRILFYFVLRISDLIKTGDFP